VVHPDPHWGRAAAAGLVTGLLAIAAPQIMGVSYDSVSVILQGQLGIGVLLTIAAAKLLATAAAIGLGLPGGLIGPSLVMGAAVGGSLGVLVELWYPGGSTAHPFYAMIGMGAMMAATLQAPLAALMALLELTANPRIIFPGMLAVVTASMVASEVFGKTSIFLMLLRARGLDYRQDPVAQALRRIGVASVMDRRFVTSARRLTAEQAGTLLQSAPRWILVDGQDGPQVILRAADLARALEEGAQAVDLLAIPGERLQLAAVNLRASLQEALETLQQSAAEALCVTRVTAPGISRLYGVLTLEDIEASYRVGSAAGAGSGRRERG
jgi:CIC family chloride channel protein